jgi:hypothetical protein
MCFTYVEDKLLDMIFAPAYALKMQVINSIWQMAIYDCYLYNGAELACLMLVLESIFFFFVLSLKKCFDMI